MENVFEEVYVIPDSPTNPHAMSLSEVKCRKRILTMIGMLIGFTCAVFLLLKDRKSVSNIGVTLIIFMALFIVFSVMFITTSVLLLLATLDNDTELISYYMWHSMAYLCMQLMLALAIPLIIVIDNKPITPVILTWLVIVLIVGLGWTHFVAVVQSYRMELVNSLSM